MSRTRTVSLTVGSIALGAVLATGLTGLAQADDSVTSTPSAASGQVQGLGDGARMGGRHDGPGGMHGRPGMGGPGGEALHGEFVVKAADGTITTMREVHGTVTAVSSSSITVKAEDGYSATFAIDEDTDVRTGLPDRNSAPDAESTDTIADVTVGDVARVHGSVSGSTATAEHVMAMSADEAAQMEALRQQHQAQHEADAASTASGTTQAG